MIDEFTRMRGYAQKCIALAHVLDQRLETPASSRMITAARQLLVEMETVEESLRPRSAAVVAVKPQEDLLAPTVDIPLAVVEEVRTNAIDQYVAEFHEKLAEWDETRAEEARKCLLKLAGNQANLICLRLVDRHLAKLREPGR